MSKTKKKYYVVWQGKEPGIYTKWEDCKKQIEGVSAPVFKSFKNPEIAKKAFLDALTNTSVKIILNLQCLEVLGNLKLALPYSNH